MGDRGSLARGGTRDMRPADVRAETIVREAEFEADGVELCRCGCGTAEVEVIPDQPSGFRCVGCKEPLF